MIISDNLGTRWNGQLGVDQKILPIAPATSTATGSLFPREPSRVRQRHSTRFPLFSLHAGVIWQGFTECWKASDRISSLSSSLTLSKNLKPSNSGNHFAYGYWFNRQWKWKCHLLSFFQLFAAPWTVAYQVPLSMEISRQEYWSELPFPAPRDLPDLGIEPKSLMLPKLAGNSWPLVPPGRPLV